MIWGLFVVGPIWSANFLIGLGGHVPPSPPPPGSAPAHVCRPIGLCLCTGAREPGGGGARGAIPPPTFCLNGMDMPVPPPKLWQSLGISTF